MRVYQDLRGKITKPFIFGRTGTFLARGGFRHKQTHPNLKIRKQAKTFWTVSLLRRYTATMNTARLLTTLFLLAMLWGCAARQPGADITLSIPVSGNPNALELKAFEDAYQEDTEKSLAARFLLDNLPPADQLSMSKADLAENLDYAFLAREAMPWGKTVPWTSSCTTCCPIAPARSLSCRIGPGCSRNWPPYASRPGTCKRR